MTVWIPTIVGALVALVGAFGGVIEPWIEAHPQVGAILAGLAVILAALLKSPLGGAPKPPVD